MKALDNLNANGKFKYGNPKCFVSNSAIYQGRPAPDLRLRLGKKGI